MSNVSLIACPECGEAYKPTRWWQTYCSSYCRLLAFRKRKRPEGEKED